MNRPQLLGAYALACLALFALGGCASSSKSSRASAPAATSSDKVDGPPLNIGTDLARIPDAEPRDEALHRFANRPYTVFGVNYSPMTSRTAFTQVGIASWYGRKFHGQKTAIGEVYDMLAMTAAHPTAPLPSFARVTHTRSGQTVVVRINDRGPFHANRIIDLSYAAAHRLGIAQAGSAEVRVELLLPPFSERRGELIAARPDSPVASPPVAPPSLVRDTEITQAGMQYFIQLGAFGNFANAEQFQQRMESNLSEFRASQPITIRQRDGLFRVQVGPITGAAQAQALRNDLQQRLGASLPLVSESPR
jgi:rare lipoprotein A